MTTDLTTADGRSVLRMRRRLRQPPHEVWPALVDPDRLAAWFPTAASIELRVGGSVTFGFGGPGTVTDLDPPRLLAYTWETDHLRWELTPDGDGTLLSLVHTFDDRGGAASFAAGWDGCFDVLEGVPEGDHQTRHESYLRQLGLLEPLVTETADGWEVRMERQLVHPAERVWPVLVEFVDGPFRLSREPECLELDVPAGGRERWELGEGTGHGARLRLIRTGPPGTDAVRDGIAATAAARVEKLLATLG